jgi:hypothetical protein
VRGLAVGDHGTGAGTSGGRSAAQPPKVTTGGYQVIAEDCENPPAQYEVGYGCIVPISSLSQADWEPTAYFRCPLFSSPSFDINLKGTLRHELHPEEVNNLRFFFKFWPYDVIENIVPFWRNKARDDDIRGLAKLDLSMFYAFIAARILMGVMSLNVLSSLLPG